MYIWPAAETYAGLARGWTTATGMHRAENINETALSRLAALFGYPQREEAGETDASAVAGVGRKQGAHTSTDRRTQDGSFRLAFDQRLPMSQPLTLPLAYDESSASAARRLVRRFGAQHNLGSTEDQSLIASELVTNAVLHGGEPVELTLQHQDDELTIEVADGDPRIDDVRMRAVDRRRPGGRGLRIVASLAKRWGVRPFRSGKQVWAATDAPPA